MSDFRGNICSKKSPLYLWQITNQLIKISPPSKIRDAKPVRFSPGNFNATVDHDRDLSCGFDLFCSNTVRFSSLTLALQFGPKIRLSLLHPSILVAARNATATVGPARNLSVSAMGLPTELPNGKKNGANITGATGAVTRTPATTKWEQRGRNLNCVVSNAAGSMTTAAATLTVSSSATLQSIAVSPASPLHSAGVRSKFTATGLTATNSTKKHHYQRFFDGNRRNAFSLRLREPTDCHSVAAGTTPDTATQGSIVSPNDPLTVTLLQ